MSEYMNINEAAAFTGYTATALYRKVARRQIPYRKHGRRLIFKRSELLEFLKALPGVRIGELTPAEDRSWMLSAIMPANISTPS